ncbi:MAG: response regulator transcription factor [Acidobacteriota bacterium]|jgi:two-component system phosphate regulon response regulator PhoB|nr:response regulator transcription factor [Acidobacteriota bacterium]
MAGNLVLVIDDEKDLLELVRYNLEKEGYRITTAEDGESGLRAAVRESPDIVIIDLMLPGMDGLDVCRRLREDPRTIKTPVIMLTAKSSETDRIVGLEIGADDYVTKPFSPRELAARIKAVLRRTSAQSQTQSPDAAPALRRGGLTVDPTRRSVVCDGKNIDLTATEFRLLHLLAKHPGRVYSRAELIGGALGRDIVVSDRTIDVHITGLRRKLGDTGELVETVRGFGYRFRE